MRTISPSTGEADLSEFEFQASQGYADYLQTKQNETKTKNMKKTWNNKLKKKHDKPKKICKRNKFYIVGLLIYLLLFDKGAQVTLAGFLYNSVLYLKMALNSWTSWLHL